MPDDLQTKVAFHSLYRSPILQVSDYQCRPNDHDTAVEEHSDFNSVVLMRHGAFAKHIGRRRVTADVNQAIFFSKNSTYRISHPAGCGDRGTSLTISPRVLNDIVRELDPAIDDHPDRPFPFISGPCESKLFWRHRELIMRLEAAEAEPLEHLWAEVTVLQLVADVLEAAFAKNGSHRKPGRKDTESDHADRTEAAKGYLARNLGEQITLDDVAREVYSSPFNFARIFQRQTGLPIHRYLTVLRLRVALERLSDGAEDLTSLALDLGFSSHSHFTNVFRKEFGKTPSEMRVHARQRDFRELSKNLIA